MLRALTPVLVPLLLLASLAACGGGRCVADKDCPPGASCDVSYGVCLSAAASNLTRDGGSSTQVGPGYARQCQSDANCADVPNSACNSGMCISSCENGKSCPAGSICLAVDNQHICALSCTSDASCLAGSACKVVPSDYGVPSGTHVCAPTAKPKSSVGGTCASTSDCLGGAQCVITAGIPDGLCTMSCKGDPSVCGSENQCVSFGAERALCLQQCASPGTQSTCRADFKCVALVGQSYGVCLF